MPIAQQNPPQIARNETPVVTPTREQIPPTRVDEVLEGGGLAHKRVTHRNTIPQTETRRRLGEGSCGQRGEEGRQYCDGIRVEMVWILSRDCRGGSPEHRHEGYTLSTIRMSTSDDADAHQFPRTNLRGNLRINTHWKAHSVLLLSLFQKSLLLHLALLVHAQMLVGDGVDDDSQEVEAHSGNEILQHALSLNDVPTRYTG